MSAKSEHKQIQEANRQNPLRREWEALHPACDHHKQLGRQMKLLGPAELECRRSPDIQSVQLFPIFIQEGLRGERRQVNHLVDVEVRNSILTQTLDEDAGKLS